MRITNPHDKFVKDTLNNIKNAQSFLINYLPDTLRNAVDISTLEPQKDSFINKNLEEGFSDLLFKAMINGQEGYFYFLIEHKSYVSKDLPLQLLDYMVYIWQSKMSKEHATELPVIFPLVLRHNVNNRNNMKTLGEMIKGYQSFNKDIQQFIPDFEFLLYDLSTYDDSEIRGTVQLRILFLLLRDIPVKKEEELWKTVERAVEYLSELADEQTEQEFFQTMMIYLFSASRSLTKKDLYEMNNRIKLIDPKRSEEMMSLADILRREGKIEGKMEGKREGKIEVIQNLLNEGFKVESIAKFTGLSMEEVNNIINNL
ncbi:Rpn family recombination-promoting nuclease/putative transposase [Oceanobacillus sp. CAU 1775]